MKVEELQRFGIETDEIHYQLAKLKNHKSIIVVTGEFSAGKSYLINCLLHSRDLLPSGNQECTPVLVELFKGEEREIVIKYVDGREAREKYSKEIIEKYARYHRNNPQDVLSLDVPCSDFSLPESVHIIDTPGTNTIHKEHEKITEYIISKADLIIYTFNKVIGSSDIKHIKNIKKQTGNIVYVMTHADDINSKTGERFTQSDIDRLLNEARSQLCNAFDCNPDDIILMPIGSDIGLSDRTLPDQVISCISEFVNSQSEERRRVAVKKKIQNIIDDQISALKRKREVAKTAASMDMDALNEKIESFYREKENAEKSHTMLLQRAQSQAKNEFERISAEFIEKLNNARDKILKLLDDNNINQVRIETLIGQMNEAINADIRRMIETSISDTVSRSYNELNVELNDLSGKFEQTGEIRLSTPSIEDLSHSRTSLDLVSIREELKETVDQLNKMAKSSSEEEQNQIKCEIKVSKQKLYDLQIKLTELGVYIPEYDEVTIKGGENNGKKVGRAIGEIADLALLIWNPAGAAAEAGKGAKVLAQTVHTADKAKDITTLVRYVRDFIINSKPENKTFGEKKSKKSKKKKIEKTIKKIDNKRKELIDAISKEENDNLSMALDLFSLGFWSEMVGGAIGKSLFPDKIDLVENEEVKKQYNAKRSSILRECGDVQSEINKLEDSLSDLDDFGKEQRIKKNLVDKRDYLQKLERQLQIEEEHEQADYKRQAMVNQYTTIVKNYYDDSSVKGKNLLHVIYVEFANRLTESLEYDYNQKIDEIDDSISTVINEQENLLLGVDYLSSQIDKLTQSKEYIEEWLRQ